MKVSQAESGGSLTYIDTQAGKSLLDHKLGNSHNFLTS